MRISEKKSSELYNAIAARIMGLRVELKMNPSLAEPEELDCRLFELEKQIWPDVKKALNITDA